MVVSKSKEFEEYYKQKRVVETYDLQREGKDYRKKKRMEVLKIYLELLDKKDNEKVLEIGCGTGFLTQYLGKVIAIDTSEQMLKIAMKKCPNANLIQASMFKLPFKNNSFDKIVTHRVIGNLDYKDFEKVLIEIKRVLKKDGKFIFDMGDSSKFRYYLRKFISFFYRKLFNITGYGSNAPYYSMKLIKSILKKTGFKIKRIKYHKNRIDKGMIIKVEPI